MVSFDKRSINAYYQIEDMSDDDEFTAYMTEDLELDQVIKTLCKPSVNWKSKEHEAISFSHNELSRYGKAWYYFMCQAHANQTC